MPTPPEIPQQPPQDAQQEQEQAVQADPQSLESRGRYLGKMSLWVGADIVLLGLSKDIFFSGHFGTAENPASKAIIDTTVAVGTLVLVPTLAVGFIHRTIGDLSEIDHEEIAKYAALNYTNGR